MTTDLSAFYTDLMQLVTARASASEEHTRSVLVSELVERVARADELQDWVPCYFDGKGTRGRRLAVDGYSIDDLDLDGTLQIIIAVTRDGSEPEVLGLTELRAVFKQAATFVDEARAGKLSTLEPSTPAADLANLITSRGDIKRVRVLLVSNVSFGSRVREMDRESIPEVKLELSLWDLNRFHQLASAGGREELDIDLERFVPGGLSALPASIGTTGYQAFLCAVPGRLLADIYDEHGSRLLESNVRAFLSTTGSVNKGIRRTILEVPGRFFAFNNGITATATGVDERSEHGLCKLLRIRNLQIVNGGQTTASLFSARVRDKAALDDVFVQMKLSVLSPDIAETMIPEISRYANTQNRVSDADLFANHPFHRKVEVLSRRIWAPARSGTHQMTHWFYERARAQYQTEQFKLSSGAKREFLVQNPKDQVISKTDLAKYENTWAKLPHLVSAGAQKNFVSYAEKVRERFDQSEAGFNERWFQHVVAKALLFRKTELLVSGAGWYPGGYRANIVTYGIAFLVRTLERAFPRQVLDLDKIWRTQRVQDATERQLLLCAEVACEVLVTPPAVWANVTEWAKKDQAWKALETRGVTIAEGIEDDLKATEDEQLERRDARDQDREDDGILAQAKVLELAEKGYWRRAAASPIARRVLSPTDYDILTRAARGGRWTPSELQARRLVAALGRLEKEGLTP